MKLIFGKFHPKQVEEIQRAFEQAQRYYGHVIVPYYGDQSVQVIDLPRRKQPWRRDTSLYAHRVNR